MQTADVIAVLFDTPCMTLLSSRNVVLVKTLVKTIIIYLKPSTIYTEEVNRSLQDHLLDPKLYGCHAR